MPEVFIDEKRYEFEGKPRLLQFIMDQGLEVPYFCYHPSMSVPANCRQCMVKVGQPVQDRETGEYETDENGERVIRWFPKLQTACNMVISDGMVVKTQETDELVERAQKDNLEFILINHPLDCPICDQAGECPLQIQTYKFGPEGSRFEVNKVHKPKRVELGPRVVLDAERCINCTRCTRFTEEISQTHQLTITKRGDKNYPTTMPGETFNDPYSLNTVDICPVGALTSADFRFRARVWEMNQTPGIDLSNGKGCNIDVWTRDNLVLRLTPRYNPSVNDYWMPDEGRMFYTTFNENRISRPSIGIEDEDQEQIKTSWNNAFETFSEQLELIERGEILVIGSPYASVEENYILNKFSNLLGLPNPIYTPDIKKDAGDGFLLTDDQAPNTIGAELTGIENTDSEKLKKLITSKKYRMVILLSDHLIDRNVITKEDLDDKYTVIFATNESETTRASDLLIPITTAVEHAASYVNVDGRIQRTFPAKETKYTNRRLELEMSEGRLDRYGTNFDNWVSEDNKVDCLPLWDVLHLLGERLGLDITYEGGAREIMNEISTTLPVFEDVSYERMDEELGIQLDVKKEIVTS